MEEWREVALGEIANVKGGKRLPSGATLTDSRTSHPYLRIVDFKDGGVDQSNLMYVPEEVFPKIKNYIVNSGDLYISIVGTIGLIGAIPTSLHHANLTENAAKICEFTADIDARFLSFFLRSQAGQEAIRSLTVGSTQPKLALFRIKDIRVPLPPLPEQHAIAATLGALDDKIELNRRMCETLESMARALFRDWFVDFGPTRAKMAGTAPYLAEDLWSLFPDRLDDEGKPEGWAMKPLDEVADFLNGLALQKFPASDPRNSLPVIKIAELRNGLTGKSDRASRDFPSKYKIVDGDFLFSWSGSLMAKFWTEGEGALNQHLFKVSSERYPPWFYSEWVQHHLEEFQLIAASKATTMGHIQRGHLKAAMTFCPPDNLIAEMGRVIGPLVARAIENELQSRTLAETRDLLLPRLMSGALRVTDAEHLLEEVL